MMMAERVQQQQENGKQLSKNTSTRSYGSSCTSYLRIRIIRKQIYELVERKGSESVIQFKRKGERGKAKAKDPFKKPKIDYATGSIDGPFPGGPNYFDLALVCPFLQQSATLS
jgi:hypothetical protein